LPTDAHQEWDVRGAASMNRPSRVVSALVTLGMLVSGATAGCAAAASSEESSASEIKSEVDYSGAPRGNFVHDKNIDHYKLFANRDEAVAWWATFDLAVGKAEGRAAARPVVDHADPRYAVAEQVVAELWPAFQRVFPEDTRDLPTPVVLLVTDETVNAFAVYDRDLAAAPDAFIILTGSIASGGATDSLRGLIAHELGHLVLKHGFPGNADKLSRFYRATGTSEPLGFMQSNDASLQKSVSAWLDDAQLAGSFPLDELHGLPINIIGNPPLLFGVLRGALQKQIVAAPAACGPAKEAANALITAMKNRTSIVDYDMDLSSAARAELDGAAIAAVASLRTCLQGSTDTIPSLAAEQFNLPPAALEAHLPADDVAAMHAAPSLLDAIVAVTTNTFARMKQTQQAIGMDAVRNYTTEEQADDASAYVLAALGRNPEAQALFLTHGLMNDAQRAECVGALRDGKSVPYGLLSDPHHGACWRVGHLQRMHQHIAPGIPGTFDDEAVAGK
jgi:hypothetical protein